MSGSTPELNLATAVDSDDNADYLTINLANSLRTVDALFNNVTGHNHNGAHQGGAVAPATGSITSGMIADGTIVAADIADGTITNAKLNADTARANLLVNGGFEVWQRGNGPFNQPGTVYGPDRWGMFANGTDTMFTQKETTFFDSGSLAACRLNFTLGTGAGGSSLYQQFKTSDGPNLNGKTVTFSVRTSTSTANAVTAKIGADGTGAPSNVSAASPGDGAYHTLTATITVPTNATVVTVYVMLAATTIVMIDNAMLVVGTVPATYAPLHPADDLARCLRYYETWGLTGNSFPMFKGTCGGAGEQVWTISFSGKKALQPTVTKTGTWTVSNCGQPDIPVGGTSGFGFRVSTSASGQFSVNAADATCGVTAEANP